MTMVEDNAELVIPIKSSSDITRARQEGRTLALSLGLGTSRGTLAATVITELAENIFNHSNGGVIILAVYAEGERTGLCITARDEGPGIANIEQVMRTGLSSSSRSGYGLPELRSLADVFGIESSPELGTTVLVVLFPGKPEVNAWH